MNDRLIERSAEIRMYLIGFALSLILTAAAFAAVRWRTHDSNITFAVVLALGFVQLLVQLRCFLHISLKKSARTDLELILFSALIIALMVSGTLVVLFNLRERMM